MADLGAGEGVVAGVAVGACGWAGTTTGEGGVSEEGWMGRGLGDWLMDVLRGALVRS